jgi:hypothetical protein
LEKSGALPELCNRFQSNFHIALKPLTGGKRQPFGQSGKGEPMLKWKCFLEKAKNEIFPGRVQDLWNRIVLLDIDVLFFRSFPRFVHHYICLNFFER